DDWLQAIRTGDPPQLDARTALPTVRLIEECYQNRTALLDEPWVHEGLNGNARASECAPIANCKLQNANLQFAVCNLQFATPRSSAKRRVLITGAAGFIGCRLAEVLHL